MNVCSISANLCTSRCHRTASSASLQLGPVTFTIIYTKITVFSVTAKGKKCEKSAGNTSASWIIYEVTFWLLAWPLPFCFRRPCSRTLLLGFALKCGTEVSRHATKVIINDKHNNYEYYLTQLLICTSGRLTKQDKVFVQLRMPDTKWLHCRLQLRHHGNEQWSS